MMKKRIIFIAVGGLLVAVFLIFAMTVYNDCFAEEEVRYVLCRPGVEVNVRYSPRKGSEIIGNLDCGDAVRTDGKEKNGYVHITGLTFEYSEGWIYKGLLIAERPYVKEWQCQIVTGTRVAARHYIGGKRKGWIKPGAEWSITNRGYVKTEFLTLNYPKGGW